MSNEVQPYEYSRIVGFVSGKGGVGKTTLTELGNDVTVIDTDFSASNLATYLGHYDHPVNIQDVLHDLRLDTELGGETSLHRLRGRLR